MESEMNHHSFRNTRIFEICTNFQNFIFHFQVPTGSHLFCLKSIKLFYNKISTLTIKCCKIIKRNLNTQTKKWKNTDLYNNTYIKKLRQNDKQIILRMLKKKIITAGNSSILRKSRPSKSHYRSLLHGLLTDLK